MRQKMAEMVHRIQDEICQALREIDGVDYRQDEWTREEGGGGRSRVFSGGKVFEKAGVNVSVVHGTLSPQAANSMGGGHELKGADLDFFATGISLVLHPLNPMAPTVHANYRYFERGEGNKPGSWWFGGGADLTPSYLFEEDAIHFHQVHKDACDRHEVADYSHFKQWCDDYFFLSHRNEPRGVGGIFYDELNTQNWGHDFAFTREVGKTFLKSYSLIVSERKDKPWTNAQRDYQLERRGRYVEFNLLHDRGTQFGLKTGGNLEAIFMSLPPTVTW